MAVANKKRKIFDDRYEILSIIGRGSQSVVYQARNVIEGGPEVALKVLVNKKGSIPNSERLRKEALAMVSCNHRFVVRLDDFHTIGDVSYLSMELAPGGDLRKFIHQQGKLPPQVIERFFTQTAEALDYIHKVGIIHRDVKPDNILVLSEKEIRLGDFGIALLPGETPASEDAQLGVGTLDYLPPEILEGKQFNISSDLYSLGICFYEIVAGKTPFADVPLAQQLEARKNNHVKELPKFREDIPAYLYNAIIKMLSYDAADRFGTAGDLLKALKNASQGEPITVQKTAPKPVELKPAAPAAAAQATTAAPVSASPVSAAPAATSAASSSAAATPAPATPAAPAAVKPSAAVPAAEASGPKVEIIPINQTTPPSNASAKPAEARIDPVKPAADRPSPAAAVSPLKPAPAASQVQPVQEEDEEDYEDEEDDFEPLDTEGEDEADADIEEVQRQSTPARTKAPSADYYQEERRRTAPGSAAVRQPNSFFSTAVITITALVLLGIWAMRQSGGTVQEDPVLQQAGLRPVESFGSALVSSSFGNSFDFSRLQPGIYSGKAGGIIPGRELPMTFIVRSDSSRAVTVIIGVEGWTPQTVSLDSEGLNQKPNTLRVASNGFVLDFKAVGRMSSDQIEGEVGNLITHESGFFALTPAM